MVAHQTTIPVQKVLIVEDSAVVRLFLEEVVRTDDRLSLCGAVESAEEALNLVDKTNPDVISMDIHLPGMDGIEATQRIMEEWPTPIVVISASVDSKDLNSSMDALKAGALTVLEKPAGMDEKKFKNIGTQLYLMSQVKVIKKRRTLTDRNVLPEVHKPIAVGRKAPFKMVGIASSTGGPQALIKLFTALGSDFDLPILLVQHMTDSFLDGFVKWLNDCCPLEVVRAKAGDIPEKGFVYVAPPGQHMLFRHGRITMDKSDPVCSQLPSGDLLLASMGKELGASAIGMVLTGMGEDGSNGLKEMRLAGGWTLSENEQSAVVYGMPKAAVQKGAVIDALPLDKLAPRVLELVANNG